MTSPSPSPRSSPALRRVVTFWPLLFYGLGVIVGAGIYVAAGSVIQRAGDAAPISFLLAGIAAGLTGVCYAELAARFPEAAGAAAYVRRGLGSDRLSLLVGAATTLAVAVATASIAHGAVVYLALVFRLPPPVLTVILVVSFTFIAALGVQTSVWLAATVGLLEIGGLVAATLVGLVTAPDLHVGAMIPTELRGWENVVAGAFIAFFAFIGFETLANMAEEVRDPSRTVPRGILGSVAASTALYVIVAAALVLSDRGGTNPLLGLFAGTAASLFALVGSVSVANGVLVEINMLARLFYGMAQSDQLPAILGTVSPRTRTPVVATVLAGGIVLLATLLFPFQDLLVTANTLTLGIFVLVDLALWRLHRTGVDAHEGFRAPSWVPPIAAVVSSGLIVSAFLT